MKIPFLTKSSTTSTKPKGIAPSVLGAAKAAPVFQEPEHPMKRKVELEVDSWCFGLENLGEDPLPKVVFTIVRELRFVMAEAVSNGFAFDINSMADKLFYSCKGVVSRKELLFALIAVLPEPQTLSEDEKRIFAMIIAQVEASEGGAVKRVQQRMGIAPAGSSTTGP
jgi:hypothetical protein